MVVRSGSEADFTLFKRAGMFLGAGLVLAVLVVAGLLLAGVVRWDEVVGFFDWFSRATAFGAILAGLLALSAAWLAYHGVQQTISSTEEREEKNREAADRRELESRRAVDARERERARHERFTTIVTQLASEHSMVRLGALFAVSALADEWEREARQLIRVSDSGAEWEAKEQAVLAAKQRYNRAHQWILPKVVVDASGQQSLRPVEVQNDTSPAAVAAAKREAREAMRVHTLNRYAAPTIAKDAVTHRDNCMELVTAYLRMDLRPRSTDDNAQEPRNEAVKGIETETRAAATDIVLRHVGLFPIYPWPLSQIDLSGSHLQGAQLRKADLEGLTLRGAALDRATLSSANLQRAWLRGATLVRANLSQAEMEGIELTRATLDHADLSGANLVDARLVRASLIGATLRAAVLLRTDLAGADLRGADLSLAQSRPPADTAPGRYSLGHEADQSSDTVTAPAHIILASVTDSGEPMVARWDNETRWPASFGEPVAVAVEQLAAAEVRWRLKVAHWDL